MQTVFVAAILQIPVDIRLYEVYSPPVAAPWILFAGLVVAVYASQYFDLVQSRFVPPSRCVSITLLCVGFILAAHASAGVAASTNGGGMRVVSGLQLLRVLGTTFVVISVEASQVWATR